MRFSESSFYIPERVGGEVGVYAKFSKAPDVHCSRNPKYLKRIT